ncbi:Nn.00g028820.m01.CDS01 [Neocucurbitaria sp. VM-36]
MTTNLVETQSFRGFHYRGPEFEFQMTLSPLQTRLMPDDAPLDSSDNFSFDKQLQSIETIPCMQYPTDYQEAPYKRRCDSPQNFYAAQSPDSTHSTAGRRRKSEYAEPGSARAIYLAKNRKAASKCRGKQKKHQEELVELARDVERKNKALRAEVDLLKGGIRDLMGIVAQHSDCSDKRLTAYVQREADRLAAGVMRSDIPATPLSRSSFGSDILSTTDPSSKWT